MKTFLTTVKGKIIAGALTISVVAAIAVTIVLLNAGYRTIVVEALNGVTNITKNASVSEAFVGLHLASGDEVKVTDSADLTLSLDEDKHVYAEGGTHFYIVAKGKLNDTRTDIKMDAGSNLFRIDNKLNEEEYFNVNTPNSTMAVRGTVFRVSCYVDEDGKLVTLLEVFEGEVYIERLTLNGERTGEYKVLGPGSSVKIRNEEEDSKFVDLNSDENSNSSDKNDGLSEIEYAKLSKEMAKYLGSIIDDGRDICISKELLFDYAGVNGHSYEDKIKEIAATCSHEGSYYEVCAVCGEVNEEIVIIPKTEHELITRVVKVKEKDGSIKKHRITSCKRCFEVIEDVILTDDDEEKQEVKSSGAKKEATNETTENEVAISDSIVNKDANKLDNIVANNAAAPVSNVVNSDPNAGSASNSSSSSSSDNHTSSGGNSSGSSNGSSSSSGSNNNDNYGYNYPSNIGPTMPSGGDGSNNSGGGNQGGDGGSQNQGGDPGGNQNQGGDAGNSGGSDGSSGGDGTSGGDSGSGSNGGGGDGSSNSDPTVPGTTP